MICRGKDRQPILEIKVLFRKSERSRIVIAVGHKSIVAQNAQLR